MQSHDVNRRQLGAWLFAGLSGPVAQFAGGMAWQTVALTALACLTACWLMGHKTVKPGKWLCYIECAWLVYMLAAMGRWMAGSWSDGNVYPAVPLILLALGAASAGRGKATAARAGSAVFWLVALFCSIALVAGVGQVELQELANINGKLDLRLVTVLLIPSLTVFLPGGKKKVPVGALMGIGGFTILLSVLVTGELSLPVAQSVQMPLYEWVEGLSLAGALQRFESLVSVAVTMAWFAAVSFVLTIAGELLDYMKKERAVWCTAALAGVIMLSKVGIKAEIMVFCTILLWIIIPVILAFGGRKKKFEIYENNA